METRDDPEAGLGRSQQATTRRSVMAAAAGLLGIFGVVSADDLATARRRGRNNRNRNKNQSNATSTGEGGAGGTGGDAGTILVVCEPGFQNCQIVDEP